MRMPRFATSVIATALFTFVTLASVHPAEARKDMSQYETVLYSLILMHSQPPYVYYAISGRGRAIVTFSVDRQGKLLEVKLDRHSARTPFGDEARRIVKKASRYFPAPPADLPNERLTFCVPISFSGR
ncbi:hypothetical protein GCM10008179_10170 [Hansschlegelia plantiphila]|uniref:TonB C-terminal domain-containing protein n=2 Tax=Hansschlegelia plantiphila TaxID=374655 RepID=A0A9W6J145_9HYPH|nr:hypothetical protein GCM10008179_10170 [Hansschlegelia plantiphila]